MDLGTRIAVAYSLHNNIFVAMNGDYKRSLKLSLPVGDWHIIADAEKIDFGGQQILSETVFLPPTSGMILVKSKILKNM